MAEPPPPKLMLTELSELLAWYEDHLCTVELIDPRGHRVKFDPERFPYLIKLRDREGKKLKKPLKKVLKIRDGKLTNKDFGGFDPERAQTLAWLVPIILRPTAIAANQHLFVPGDEVYIKEFDRLGYRYKRLICKRVDDNLLVPITSFPRGKFVPKKENIIWP